MQPTEERVSLDDVAFFVWEGSTATADELGDILLGQQPIHVSNRIGRQNELQVVHDVRFFDIILPSGQVFEVMVREKK